MHRIFIFIALFLSAFTFSQQAPPSASEAVVERTISELNNDNFYDVDSLLQNNVTTENKVYPKSLDSSFKNKYKGDEYDYSITKPKKSFWQKLKHRFAKIIESVFGKMDLKYNTSLQKTILKFLGIVLGAFLLFFLLRFFFDKNRRSIFGKKNVKLDIEVEELHDNIHEIDFPKTILDLESKKDFRSAVRYQFLYVLKNLNAKNLIVWNPEKTNRDYKVEIKDSSLLMQYERWSYIFEYVWYGEFDIDEEEYQKLKSEFETAKF